MKINAYNRLRNVLTANLQEDTEAVTWLKYMADRLGTLSFPNKDTGNIKGKNSGLQLLKDPRGYNLYFSHRDGPLNIILYISAPSIEALKKTFISELEKEVAKHVDEERKLYEELQEYKYAIRNVRRAFL